MKVAFLHDTVPNYLGGAEMSNQRVIEVGEKHFDIQIFYDELKDFDKTKDLIASSDAVIVSNTFRCKYEFELFEILIGSEIPYIRWEHDYGFCAKRNGYCFVTSKVKNCCSGQRFKHFRNHFAKSRLSVFTSPKHHQYHKEVYGDAIHNVFILPPPIQTELYQQSLEKQKDVVCFLGDLNNKKGGNDLIGFAEQNPQLKINVYGQNRLEREVPANVVLHGKVENHQVAEILGRSEYFFFKPVWPEPAGRVAAEAFLANCKMICNDKVGTFSYPFYPNDPKKAVEEFSRGPYIFWERFLDAVKEPKPNFPKWKKLLIHKSYGGLGDVFLALPAILKAAAAAEQTTLAVPDVLVEIFSQNLKDIQVIPMTELDGLDKGVFDKIIDIKNYPSFRKRKEADSRLTFPSHRRVLQHAVKHYIDAVSTLHPAISNKYERYPYFEQKVNTGKPFFTVHPGAGFLPKCWPEENYAQLIKATLELIPELECKVILGKNDADNGSFDSLSARVKIIRDDLTSVADLISQSTFHIGNDSGITHLAGMFNIPTVSIHGPSGPGSWSSFSEKREVIWGKQGKCNIACNYNTAISCEHRACLTTVSTERVLHAVLCLFGKMNNQSSTKRYIKSPWVTIDKREDGVHISSEKEEFFIDTSDDQIFSFFEMLQNDTPMASNNAAPLSELKTFLQSKQVIFPVPDLVQVD